MVYGTSCCPAHGSCDFATIQIEKKGSGIPSVGYPEVKCSPVFVQTRNSSYLRRHKPPPALAVQVLRRKSAVGGDIRPASVTF